MPKEFLVMYNPSVITYSSNRIFSNDEWQVTAQELLIDLHYVLDCKTNDGGSGPSFMYGSASRFRTNCLNPYTL